MRLRAANLLAQTPAPSNRPQSSSSAPASTITPSTSNPAAVQAPDQSVSGGKLHGVVKSGNVPLPGVTVTAQNTPDRKALFHHHRYYRRMVADDSAERALCDSHAVCGVCAGRAGGAAECDQPRPDGELRFDAGFAGGAAGAATGKGTVGRRWRRLFGSWPGMVRRA